MYLYCFIIEQDAVGPLYLALLTLVQRPVGVCILEIEAMKFNFLNFHILKTNLDLAITCIVFIR